MVRPRHELNVFVTIEQAELSPRACTEYFWPGLTDTQLGIGGIVVVSGVPLTVQSQMLLATVPTGVTQTCPGVPGKSVSMIPVQPPPDGVVEKLIVCVQSELPSVGTAEIVTEPPPVAGVM